MSGNSAHEGGRLSILCTGRLYPHGIGIILTIFAIYSINIYYIYISGNRTSEYREYEHEKFPPSTEERKTQPEHQYTKSFRISHLLIIDMTWIDVCFLSMCSSPFESTG